MKTSVCIAEGILTSALSDMGWASASEDAKQKEIGMINPIQKLREFYSEPWWMWYTRKGYTDTRPAYTWVVVALELVTKTMVLMLGLMYACVFTLIVYAMVSDVITGEDSFTCDPYVEECYDYDYL